MGKLGKLNTLVTPHGVRRLMCGGDNQGLFHHLPCDNTSCFSEKIKSNALIMTIIAKEVIVQHVD